MGLHFLLLQISIPDISVKVRFHDCEFEGSNPPANFLTRLVLEGFLLNVLKGG